MRLVRAAWPAALALSVAVALAPGATLAAASEGAAGDGGSKRKFSHEELAKVDIERKVRRASMRVASRISRYTSAALEASDEGSPEDGLALLDKLNPSRLNPLEQAQLYQVYVSLYYTASEYDKAVDFMKKVLDLEIMDTKVDNRLRFSIAQVRASTQDWDGVLAELDDLARYVDEELPLALYLRGTAWYQKGDIAKAIEYTGRAIDAADEPNESWLRLLAGLYVQNEDYASAVPVLEELLVRFPKKDYWVQLSLIYGARDNYTGSLAVQQAAYLQGFLTEDKELRRLARSYLYADLPYPAAKVLSKGLEEGKIERDAESLELLANSLVASREYEESLEPLKEAAELADHGNLFARLGQVYLQREKWHQAAENLERAIQKGKLKNDGSAYLLLGIAYYNDGRIGDARTAFEHARKNEKTRGSAEGWITHINNEQARQTEAS